MKKADSTHDAPQPTKRHPELDALDIVRKPRNEVLHAVGQGGAGKVEAVFDTVLRRAAARKSLLAEHEGSPKRVRQFVREARITSQLDHPNIVPVHDLGLDSSGRLFFTLRLVEGRTLSQIIDAWRDVGVEEAALLDVLDSLVKVCDALSLAHSRGVVHCDVKPDNIMIGDHGETYLMDWGAALVLPDRGASAGASWPHLQRHPRPSLPGDEPDDTIGGTPNYMAPEQANGDADRIDARTDVFGVGATLYEVLTGRQPYADVDDYLAIEFAAKACWSPLSDLIEAEFLPPLLERVIARSMASDPEDRYDSIEQMKSDLVRYVRGGREFPVVRFGAGTVVVAQGDEGDCAYIIARGHCDVVKDGDGQRTTVRRLGPGEVFGETALLSPGPRTASVIAVDDVSVQVIQRDVLAHELDATRPWLAKLVRTVANRFREMDARTDPARFTASPLRTAKHAAMFLCTWGERQADGSLACGWSSLCRELGVEETDRGALVRTQLESFPAFRVDVDRDRVALADPRAFVAFIARQPAT